MAYGQEWLEDQNAIRGILVELQAYNRVTSLTESFYLSNIGYVTSGTSNVLVYEPIIVGGLVITEAISTDLSASMSVGDISIANYNGEKDAWLDPDIYVWANRPIMVYIGDPSWECSSLAEIHNTFGLAFSGIIEDIDSKSQDTLDFKIRDRLELINTPISDITIGIRGTGDWDQPNIDTIRPLIFGEVFNVPVEYIGIESTEATYTISDSTYPIESIIEIRDNAVPIYNSVVTTGATLLANNTEFYLSNAPAGTITVSAQGIKQSASFSTSTTLSPTYKNTVASTIAVLVTSFGTPSENRLLPEEIDPISFSSFDTVPIGLYLSDKSNVIEVCNSIAASIGAVVFMSREGKLKLLRIGDYTDADITTITSDDMLANTLEISTKLSAAPSVYLGSCKNWFVQEELLTSIPENHKQLFSEELKNTKKENTTTLSLYKLSSLAEATETLLIRESDAITEAQRRVDFFGVPRYIYRFVGTSKLLSLEVGQEVIIQHSRFNLSAGKSGQVISLTPNWLKSTIEVEVII